MFFAKIEGYAALRCAWGFELRGRHCGSSILRGLYVANTTDDTAKICLVRTIES